MIKKIIIGCRSSKLSLAYTNLVVKQLKKKSILRSSKILIKKIKTKGDKFKDKKISNIGGKSVFCKEIEQQLKSSKIDLAVHSLKDLESIDDPKLSIGAYLKRNDPREVFVSKRYKKLSELKGGCIGTSSPRRKHQIGSLNSKLSIKSIRGNVDTRLEKIDKQLFDGAILAYAGIKILKKQKYIKEIFSIKKILPSAGQGVIAVQCRKKDKIIKNILKKINHKKTMICAKAEREFLKTIGGDCNTAVGCNAQIRRKKILLRTQLFADNGKKSFKAMLSGKILNPTELGKRVGKKILKKSSGYYKIKK